MLNSREAAAHQKKGAVAVKSSTLQLTQTCFALVSQSTYSCVLLSAELLILIIVSGEAPQEPVASRKSGRSMAH